MICLCILLLAGSQEVNPPDVEGLRGSNHGHTYTVRLVKRAFRRKDHKITLRKYKGYIPNLINYQYLIDGRAINGTSGRFLPDEELSAFDVHVDGKRWKVPDRLWWDCFNPDFDDPAQPLPNGYRYLHAWLSKDGKRLTVSMKGGDGEGAYSVIWHLSKGELDRRQIVEGD